MLINNFPSLEWGSWWKNKLLSLNLLLFPRFRPGSGCRFCKHSRIAFCHKIIIFIIYRRIKLCHLEWIVWDYPHLSNVCMLWRNYEIHDWWIERRWYTIYVIVVSILSFLARRQHNQSSLRKSWNDDWRSIIDNTRCLRRLQKLRCCVRTHRIDDWSRIQSIRSIFGCLRCIRKNEEKMSDHISRTTNLFL